MEEEEVITLINAFSGNESEVKPKGKRLTLDEFYSHIGNGCDVIERVGLADNRAMYLDGEGKFRTLQIPNAKATALLAEAGGIVGDVVGNVLILDPEDEDDEGE